MDGELTLNSNFAERNQLQDLSDLSQSRGKNMQGPVMERGEFVLENSLGAKRLSTGDVRSFRSQQSRDVDRVVKRINHQYAKLMNDVHRYKTNVPVGPPN